MNPSCFSSTYDHVGVVLVLKDAFLLDQRMPHADVTHLFVKPVLILVVDDAS